MATDSTQPDGPGLFAVDELLPASTDQRSVGEMLWDADRVARELLIEVDFEDADGLLRGWPGAVAAAGKLWTALPDTGQPVPNRRDDFIEQLQEAAHAVDARLSRGDDPDRGPDPRMTQIAADFTRSARLVRRFGAQAAVWRPDVQRDLSAARARTMHTLYVATHAVIVALRAQRNGRHADVGPVNRWIVRMTACETLASGYATGRLPHALGGEAQHHSSDPDRVQRALTRWDLQVHRTLAREPSVTNLEAIARAEAGIASIGQILLNAADHGHVLPGGLAVERLDPTLGRTVGAWRGLARRWADLRTPTTPVDQELARAAFEVRAAFRELAHDGTTMASTEAIAVRPGLSSAAATITAAAATSPERASLVADQADRQDLTGPARAIALRIRDDIGAGVTDPPADEDAAWVSPADIAAGRVIRVPPPIIEGLRAASATVEAAATTVGSIAATDSAATRCAADTTPSRAIRREEPPGTAVPAWSIRP